jgi:hypothetical protein
MKEVFMKFPGLLTEEVFLFMMMPAHVQPVFSTTPGAVSLGMSVHLPYSQDLASNDFHFFRSLKKKL